MVRSFVVMMQKHSSALGLLPAARWLGAGDSNHNADPRVDSALNFKRLCTFALPFVTSVLYAADAPVFERDVQPLLKRHCWLCHGEEAKPKGGVDLRLRRFMDKETESGLRVIEPGAPEKSEMLQLVRTAEMPKKGSKLTAEEIAIIEQWIAGGAKTAREEPAELPPGPLITDEDPAFWAFQPITRPPVPSADSTARVRTPVDAFLYAKLQPLGLAFAPDADRVTRIRRVWLDLLRADGRSAQRLWSISAHRDRASGTSIRSGAAPAGR